MKIITLLYLNKLVVSEKIHEKMNNIYIVIYTNLNELCSALVDYLITKPAFICDNPYFNSFAFYQMNANKNSILNHILGCVWCLDLICKFLIELS